MGYQPRKIFSGEVKFLDQTDYEIIRILSKNARVPFQKISKILGIGIDTVIRRYKKLEKEGVILGSTIIINSQACGIKGLLGLFLKVKNGVEISTVKEKLIKDFKFDLLNQEFGDYNFYAELYLITIQQTIKILNELREIKEFEKIDLMFYTRKDWPIPYIFTFESNPPNWNF
jgi:DNA-binding Lrp family transcriptional regulator